MDASLTNTHGMNEMKVTRVSENKISITREKGEFWGGVDDWAKLTSRELGETRIAEAIEFSDSRFIGSDVVLTYAELNKQ